MTDKLKQIIKDEVVKLPKENQEVINSFGWEKVSEDIGNKYLLEDDINDFQIEVFLVLVGLEDPYFFSTRIENNIGTSKEEAKKISDEVFEKIFIPVADTLVEKIKKNGKMKNGGFNQTVDFIISGGDYSSFVEERKITEQNGPEEIKKEDIQNNLEKTLGIKDKFVI